MFLSERALKSAHKLMYYQKPNKCEKCVEKTFHKEILACAETKMCGRQCGILSPLTLMPRAVKARPVEVERKKAPLYIIGVLFLGVLITGGTILWAKSDTGQIDVSATIANSRVSSGEAGVGDNAPPLPEQAREAYTSLPNGGLQAQGGTVAAPAPEPEPALTASTTASSTEQTTEGDGAQDGENVSDSEAETDGSELETPATTETGEGAGI